MGASERRPHRARQITQERISAEDRRYLGGLPVSKRVTLDGAKFLLVHATPRDPLDEYSLADVDFWSRRLADIDAQVICVGHTHHPYILEVNNKLIINPGSVGQPRDGDPRASYAIIDNQRVELKRIEYPVEDTVKTVLDSPLPETARDMLVEVLRSGGVVKPDSGRVKKDEDATPPSAA
jgi:predicted phosphodiesterase